MKSAGIFERSIMKSSASSGVHRLAGVEPLAGRDLELEVQADVDDDAHGAHRLGREHPELVGGVVEVPELAHQPFGVERPALGVAGAAGERALEAGEGVGEVSDLRDLQVMARDALVVTDRDLAPEREPGLAQRRVPGAAGPAEVLGRARVVHRGRAARGRDHRLDLPDRRGDVEVHAVELDDGRVEQVLQPRAERVDTLDRAVGIGARGASRRRRRA